MRILSAALVGLLLHGAAACGDGKGSPVEMPVAASVQKLDGDEQEALAFSPLPEPLRVRVTDRDGDPVAGVSVSWRVSAGTLSAPQTLTDAQGVALVYWEFRNGNNSMPLGQQVAEATVTHLPSVVFNGYVRWGISLQSVSFSPAEVNVASGPATVEITVHATDDFGDVFEGVFRLFSPSTQQFVGYTPFAMASGTGKDGIWKATFQIPQNAEPGQWALELRLRSDKMSVFWPNSALGGTQIMKYITVKTTP
ncbi:Ig-like domain-containing protein [Longimicrobium sp.]|uniref:Ig-like domain-containing protein n=1 Tax=Longimicrobium sp. TaxID=2029185 RepID=UPI003B3B3F46